MTPERLPLKLRSDNRLDAAATALALGCHILMLGVLSWGVVNGLLLITMHMAGYLTVPQRFELLGWLEVLLAGHGLLLLGTFILLLAVWTARNLAGKAHSFEATDMGWRFYSRKALQTSAAYEGLSISPVSPLRMFIRLSPFPFTPLLSLPISLHGWMKLLTPTGDYYFCPCQPLPQTLSKHAPEPEHSVQLTTDAEPFDADYATIVAFWNWAFSFVRPAWLCFKLALLAYLAYAAYWLTGACFVFWGGFRFWKFMQTRSLRRACKLTGAEEIETVSHIEVTSSTAPAPVKQKPSWLGRALAGLKIVRHWAMDLVFAAFIHLPLQLLRALWLSLQHAPLLLATSLELGGGLACFSLLSWLSAAAGATALGILTLNPMENSALSPSVTRILLARSNRAERPQIATTLLERAAQAGNPASLQSVLQAGAENGIFVLDNYAAPMASADMVGLNCRAAPGEAAEKKLPTNRLPAFSAWIDLGTFLAINNASAENMRKAAETAGVRFSLNESPDHGALVLAAQCATQPGTLPFALTADAYRRTHPNENISLHTAISSGNPDLLTLAIKSGGGLEELDWQGRTPLIHALDQINEESEDTHSWQPTNGAKVRNLTSSRMPGILIDAGASLQAKDHAGRSVIWLALGRPWSIDTNHGGFTDSMRERLLAVAIPGESTASGAGLMHAAAAAGNLDLLQQLSKRGLSPKVLTHDGRSPLHYADNVSSAFFLMQAGLAPDLPDQRGQTPLHLAVLRRNVGVADVLARYTTDKKHKDLFGKTALDYFPTLSGKDKDIRIAANLKEWQELQNTLSGQGRPEYLN